MGKDGRRIDQLRNMAFHLDWVNTLEGAVLIEAGNTQVLCCASLSEGVPRWRKDTGLGWVIAEYSMLPRATATHSTRESVKGKLGGRAQGISRLIGRSLRAGVDCTVPGEDTIEIDYDVLQVDGGTRTAATTGVWIILHCAIEEGKTSGFIPGEPLKDSVCAISAGIIGGEARLDLSHEGGIRAETDMNVVMTGTGKLVEVQGTTEGEPFSHEDLSKLLGLAQGGCADLTRAQSAVTKAAKGATLTLIDGVLV